MIIGLVDTSAAPPQVPVVEFPLWLGDEAAILDRVSYCAVNGIEVYAVLDRRSFTNWQWTNARYDIGCQYWARLLPNLRTIVAGNEPEANKNADGTIKQGVDTSASSLQSEQEYTTLINSACNAWPEAFIVAGGLVGICLSYLTAAKTTKAHAQGFHPYAQSGDTIGGLVATLKQYTTLPLEATEFGLQQGAFDSEHQRAEAFTALLTGLADAGVGMAIVYRYNDSGAGDDWWVEGLESQAAIMDAVSALLPVQPAPTQATPQPEEPPTPIPPQEPSPLQPPVEPAIPEPESVPAPLFGIDVSNYQPRDLTPVFDDVQAAGYPKPQVVAVQLHMPWESSPAQWSIDQAASTASLGAVPIGIVWLYESQSPQSTAQQAIDLMHECGITSTHLCGDYEGGGKPDVAWMNQWRAAVHAAGYTPVTYMSSGSAVDTEGDPIWVANWNDQQDLDGPPNWPIIGHQFKAGAGLDDPDLDVFSPDILS